MQKTTAFVAACCRWPRNDASDRAVRAAARAIDDWAQVQQVATSHRVAPLIHLAVKDLSEEVPADVRTWAEQMAHHVARSAMQLTGEAVRLDTLFKTAGLQPLHFKGPVLGQIAFGSIALKYSRDLDIFVQASDIPAAVALLEANGYRALGREGTITTSQITSLVHNFKDLAFLGPNGTLVELHWRFTYNSGLLTGLETRLQRHAVQLAGAATLDTFNAAQTLEYLCVHGAIHHWTRLKWLSDLAAFLEALPTDRRACTIAEVMDTPASDALSQALALCDTLFGTTYAPQMSHKARQLYDHALRRIDADVLAPKSVLGDLGFIRDMWATRHLYRSNWAAFRGLSNHLYCHDDVFFAPLPIKLNGLYPFMRLPSFLFRRLSDRLK